MGTAIVLLILVFGVAAGVMTAAYLRQRIPWKSPIPFCGSGSGFVVPVGFDVLRLGNACIQAGACLVESGRWTQGQVDSVLATLHVIVVQADSWVDPASGVRIAGYSDFSLTVGRDLSALCHELAHLCESTIDRIVDETHSRWASDGTHAAIGRYEAWLASSLAA